MSTQNRRQLNKQHVNPEIRAIIRNSEPANMQAKRHYQRAHANREKKILFFGAIFATIFAVQLLISQVKLHTANVTLTATQDRLTAVQKTNADLKVDAKKINDPTYLQQILRDKYGYTKQGELIYNLPSDNN
ncbi:FtsB family cell division protein [Leuconostoc rapi]|uniref:FtsB family cell division protein n=1 Tax=Leuconostoc rapi TaxID=1406906 RepID=UPI0019586D3B|nr:septum formation initiator family protein [Leuconostoc rapi]MBM7435331.1 cell division protein DivIC [Leuconostoc rapi]